LAFKALLPILAKPHVNI